MTTKICQVCGKEFSCKGFEGCQFKNTRLCECEKCNTNNKYSECANIPLNLVKEHVQFT